jgi:V8-like Glu-specific endopeptidase
MRTRYLERGKDLLIGVVLRMPFSFPLRATSRFALLTLGAFSGTAMAAQDAGSGLPRLPDMSAYNCADAATAATGETRHIGQFINGRYYEWNELRSGAGNTQRLTCISLIKPDPKQLSSDEAKTFLAHSFAVGAPPPSATAGNTARAQAAPEAGALSDLNPADVRPEPLKRVDKTAKRSTEQTEQKASTPELPPVPATKVFDGTATPAIPRERAHAVPLAAPLAYETPLAVGVEDRTKIPSTAVYPWTTVTYLVVSYPNGESYRCTATIVSPYVVLTAGHCVHNKNRGGYVVTARVYPGQNQAVLGDGVPITPYGSKADIQQAQTTLNWTEISGEDEYPATTYRYDYAAIQFKTPFTHTSTFMPILYGSTSASVTNAGYPATIQNQTAYGLYAHTGNETAVSFNTYRSSHVREFAVDASGGNSGGPFFYVDQSNGQRYLVGSLSYGEDLDDAAGGPWYDSWNRDLVSAWAAWTPFGTPTGSTTGLRVASAFSSTMEMVESHLRFYNSGTSAGTVDVTLADYATGTILGTWNSPSIGAGVARQFSIKDLEDNAGGSFTKPAVYSLSIRPTFSGTFQNILWHKNNQTITNMSACDSMTGAQKTLIDVHSSLVPSHPASIVIHNTGSAAANISLGVYNAATGARIGTYNAGSVPANAQKLTTVAAMEKSSGFSPGSNVYHYNIKADTAFTGYLQHWLHNTGSNVITEMTATCTITAQ